MDFYKIVKKGKYYYPASLHYSENSRVTCDRCRMNDIKACLGWEEYDLCIKCVDEVIFLIDQKNDQEMTLMEQEMLRPTTRMEQRIFYSTTNMEQEMLRPTTKMDQKMTFMEQEILRPTTRMQQKIFYPTTNMEQEKFLATNPSSVPRNRGPLIRKMKQNMYEQNSTK